MRDHSLLEEQGYMLRMVSHRRRDAQGRVRRPILQSGPVPVCIKQVYFEVVPTSHLERTMIICDKFCIPSLILFQFRR